MAWCFRASLYTLFKIDPTRSADVLIEVLGKEFDGVMGCDCFSAYRRFMREFDVTLQFCLAHLIRDVKFLMSLPGKKEQAYGAALGDALRTLFGVIHQREQMPKEEFHRRLEAARDRVLQAGKQDVPSSRHAQAMARRLQLWRAIHVRDDARGGADEQRRGAGDPVRGDRQAHNAGDAKRDGTALERADLECDSDVHATGPQCVRLPVCGGEGVLRRGRGAIAVAPRMRRVR